MKFSILVTTRSRQREIINFLNSLEQQEYRDFEVLVADQNENNILEGQLQSFSFEYVYINIPPCGISEARNQLLNYATGDIICLGDDDCLYQQDLLKKMASIIRASPSAAAFIMVPFKLFFRKGTHPVSAQGAFHAAPSISIFFNAQFLNEIGKFDENIGIGAKTLWQSGEETDILVRIIKAGGLVLRCFDVIRPWHPNVDLSKKSTFTKAYAYGMGRMYLLQKHNFSLFFKLFNILYPLILLPFSFFKAGFLGARLRWTTFLGRFNSYRKLKKL